MAQGFLPAELIVVDGSSNGASETVLHKWSVTAGSKCEVKWQRAIQQGAAVQRNQGSALVTQPFVWFFDDDILFEPKCVQRLWTAIRSDEELGGVNAMIANQRYVTPGRVTRAVFRILDGQDRRSYAGKCIGPAFNVLPEDDPDLPAIVAVEWLNTTCTVYRREALPNPPFDLHFEGYSLMEDLALSLIVGRNWKLANARTARIYHDSQGGEYKSNQSALASMELINRHYVMTHILGRGNLVDYAKLALLETFQLLTPLVSVPAWKTLPGVLLGKARATQSILHQRNRSPRENSSENGDQLKTKLTPQA